MSGPELVPVRRCPECGEEFQPHIVDCSDCGVPLEHGIEGQPAVGGETGPAAHEGTYVLIPQIVGTQDVLDAGKELSGTAIRFRLVPSTRRRDGLALLVREEDAALADAFLREAGLLPPLDDSPPVGEEGGPCPACGTHVAAGSLGCAECGLVLGGDLPES
jgi:hypothetical protein